MVDQPAPTLKTERLDGRPVDQSDLQFIADVWNDPLVAPTAGGLKTIPELAERIKQWQQHWKLHGFGMTLFSHRDSGRQIGWGGLQYSAIGIGTRLTVGYIIAAREWGQGFATEIACAAAHQALGDFCNDLVNASVLSTNSASRRVLTKAGFEFECEISHDDGSTEMVYVARSKTHHESAQAT